MRQLLLLLALLLPVCVYSQFQEPFDGPAVNSKNPWSGDLDCFTIQDGWLVSQADVHRNSVSLVLPFTYAPTMQWDCEVLMDFKPSSRNHIRLHVYSDYSETLESEIDYYLQIGSNDQTISFRKLIKKNNRSETLLEKPVDALFSPTVLRIKLTLENRKTWSLYVYEQSEFVCLATCDSEVSSTLTKGNLQFECRYSKTRANSFGCNYIQVSHGLNTEPQEPEEHPVSPQLITVEVISKSEFMLEYDHPVDISDAEFSLSTIGKAIDQNYVDESYKRIGLRFEKEVELGVEYTFSCKGIKDLQGNKIEDVSNQIYLTYDDPETPEKPKDPEEPTDSVKPSFASGCVRINEIMADPPKEATGLAETEYVELFNTTAEPINLENWTFFYGDKPTILSKLDLDAGACVVLYHMNNEITIDSPGVGMALSNFPYHLANTGKSLALHDPSGKEIDRITYEKSKNGIAWERSETGLYLSTDPRGGTPGSANSKPQSDPEEPKQPVEPDNPSDPEQPSEPEQPVVPEDPIVPEQPEEPEIPVEPQPMNVFPHEIVFNELLPNPMPEGSEYIELYNRSDREISLRGLVIATRKSTGVFSTHYPLSSIDRIIPPGAYALLTKQIQGVESFYLIRDRDALHELKLPILANTSSTLVLFNASDESVVDEVCYTAEWHSPSVKNEKGISLERIDPERETQDCQNWTSASSLEGGGTPGYQNSQYGKGHDEEVTGIESPVYSEINKEYTITYHLDQSGYTCRAWVFDISGRQITEIVNHALLGTEGTLTWNGLTTNGTKVKSGLYIFYAELVHPEGKIIRPKAVFVVK